MQKTEWVVGRGKGWEVGEMWKSGQKVQTSRYKMNNGDVIDIMMTAVNNTVLYIWKLLKKKVDLKKFSS